MTTVIYTPYVSRCNPVCKACRSARNAVNGRYCLTLGIYVEYAKLPPCGRKKTE